jgi:hypothetical protein
MIACEGEIAAPSPYPSRRRKNASEYSVATAPGRAGKPGPLGPAGHDCVDDICKLLRPLRPHQNRLLTVKLEPHPGIASYRVGIAAEVRAQAPTPVIAQRLVFSRRALTNILKA